MKIKSAIELALSATWAMEERALENLLTIAAREHDASPEALEAYRARSLDNADRARQRGSTAIIDARGPLFRRANIMTALSGASSYDVLRADLQAALDEPKVRAILLNVDSPGGEVNGAAELARAIYDARGVKPIIAYVGGTGASAAYWIASAADSVVVDPTAVLGSIGVQVAYVDQEPKAGEKRYRFVSSQSPNKNPDLGTPEAADQVQATIDAMAQVFVADVARNRGRAIETVLNDFGKGGIFVGQAAVEAGLADSIGTFESTLAALKTSRGRRQILKGTSATMEDEATITAAQRDAAVTAATQAATDAERARVAGLQNLRALGATDETIAAAITAGTTVADFAASLADAARARVAADAAAAATAETERLAAEAAAREGGINALKTDEEIAAEAAASADRETNENADAVAARIAAA